MKSNLLKLLIVVIMLTSCTGCWDSKELNQRAIVAGVGIDRTENGEIELTVQVINPGNIGSGKQSTDGGGDEPVLIATTTGKTIFQAVRDFTKQISKKLYWAQNRIIVIGEAAARDGILPYIDFFMRDDEVRKRSWILVTHEKASDILQAKSELSKIPANEILDLIDAQAATSEAAREDLFSMALRLASDSTCAVVTHIGLHEGEKGKQPEILGSAIFRMDKFRAYLDGVESRGYLWIRDDIESGIIVIPSPEDDATEISMEIRKAETKMKAIMKDGKPAIDIRIEADFTIGDVAGNIDLTDINVYDELEQRCRQAIKDEINTSLMKAQITYGCDIYGFGERIHRYLPQEWKKIKDIWLSDIYQTTEVVIEANVTVMHSGLITKPIRE